MDPKYRNTVLPIAGLITGIAAAAVVGGACLWGISKGIEALLRR